MPSDPETYLQYSEVEFWFGGGLRFDATGGLRTLDSGDGYALELGWTRYVAAHHAVSLEMLSDSASWGYAVGYVARVYPLSWLSLTYGPALGASHYAFGEGAARDGTWALVFQQRLRLQARLIKNIGIGAVHFAPSLVHQLVANGEVGGVGLRGSTTAVFLSLGIGL